MVSGTNSYCRSYWCLFDHSMGLHGTGNSNVPSDARKQSHVTAVMLYVYNIFRRKFRSQTSDNMDRWKSRGGKSQRGGAEERRSEKRKSEKKEDAGARKGRKVAKHCVFPMICGSGGSKSRLAKAAGAEPCGHMRDEKLRAVVARSTFPSQNAQNTQTSDHFWKLRCRKSARRCQREAHSEVKIAKKWGAWGTFGRSDVVLRGRCRGLCTLSKVSKTWGLCSIQKRWQAWDSDISRGPGKMHFAWQAQYKTHRSGQRFAERGCMLEHEIVRFAKMTLCDGCSTSYDLASLFRGRRNTLDIFRQVEWQNRKTHWHEADSSALNFPFLKEVSQNCFVFDVVKFKNWRSLAELFRFWCCQVQKLRKSRRIVSFLTLSSSKLRSSRRIAAFSILQVDRQIDRQLQQTTTTTTPTTANTR